MSLTSTLGILGAPFTGGASLALTAGGLALDYLGNRSLQDRAQSFAGGQSAAQMQFQREMRATQYQTAVTDMKKAGLNPMLAYHQGGAGTPPGAAASGTGAHMPAIDITSGARLYNQLTQNKVLEATADKTEAEAAEIRARTPTHAVSIEKMRQDINESIERIQDIQQRVRTGQATAAQLHQHTVNLREQVPQIRAMVQNLKAATVERLTASGLNEAHAKEIHQRILANLPEIERAQRALEKTITQMGLPGHVNTQAAQDSFIGQMGAYLKALLPLQGVMGAIPLGRISAGKPTPKPEPLKFPRETHR